VPSSTTSAETRSRELESNYSAFLASPSHVHRFLLSLVTTTDVNATANALLFPGYLAIVLAAMAIVLRRRGAGAGRDATAASGGSRRLGSPGPTCVRRCG